MISCQLQNQPIILLAISAYDLNTEYENFLAPVIMYVN